MIHFFNPGTEMAVLNGSVHYHLPCKVAQMRNDLALLSLWFAEDGDRIYTSEAIPATFISTISQCTGTTCRTISKQDFTRQPNICNNEVVSLWALSPCDIHFWKQISDEYNLDLKTPEWQPEYRHLYGRKFSMQVLQALVDDNSLHLDTSLVPAICCSMQEIEAIQHSYGKPVLMKAPYSSTGRGVLFLPQQLGRSEQQIAGGFLKRQGYVTVERVREKILDFAMEFSCSRHGIVFEGYSLFCTNCKGAFQSNILCSQYEMKKVLSQYTDLTLLQKTRESLVNIMQERISDRYTGRIGVDMMFYRENRVIRLHPCVEINFRTTMGHLALQISSKYVGENAKGKFCIQFCKSNGELNSFHRQMKERHTLREVAGKIKQGYLALTPVGEHTQYFSYLLFE